MNVIGLAEQSATSLQHGKFGQCDKTSRHLNIEHLLNRSDVLANQLFYIYCIRHIFSSIFVGITCLSEELILKSMFSCFGPSYASALAICACLEVHEECLMFLKTLSGECQWSGYFPVLMLFDVL